jgi:hypothetical protein
MTLGDAMALDPTSGPAGDRRRKSDEKPSADSTGAHRKPTYDVTSAPAVRQYASSAPASQTSSRTARSRANSGVCVTRG